MYNVTRLTARLTVEVVALYEDTVITQTANPHVTLTLQYQLYTLAYVQSTHIQTDRHLQIHADRYTDIYRYRQTHTHTHRQTGIYRYRQTDTQTDRQYTHRQ